MSSAFGIGSASASVGAPLLGPLSSTEPLAGGDGGVVLVAAGGVVLVAAGGVVAAGVVGAEPTALACAVLPPMSSISASNHARCATSLRSSSGTCARSSGVSDARPWCATFLVSSLGALSAIKPPCAATAVAIVGP